MEAATSRWIAEQTDFPMPSQLRPFIERARLARVAISSGNRHLVRWECPVCHRSQSGWVTPEDREPRACTGFAVGGGQCGEIMYITHDERPGGGYLPSTQSAYSERSGRDGAQ